MRLSLFDEPTLPQPHPRLKPNIFARTTQWAIKNIPVVLVSALLLMALLAYPLLVAPPPSSPLEFAGRSEAHSNWARLQRGFPGIENLATLALAHPDAAKLQSLRQDLLEKLKARTDLFQLVLAPGAGDYYNTYGVYYHSPAELDARVAYALSLKTLFDAIAAAPKGDSLATLVNEVAASIEQGRDPQGLDMLFTEASAAVNALMSGQERRVDWLKVAGLAMDDSAQAGLVLIWPRPGEVEPANQFIDSLAQGIRADPQVSLSIQKSGSGEKPNAAPGAVYPRLGIAGMCCLLALLMLQALLGQIRLVFVALVSPAAAALAAASTLAFIAPNFWRGFWPVIIAAGAVGLVLGLRYLFAALEPLREHRPVLTSSMLAAQKQGSGLVLLGFAAMLPWCAWIMQEDKLLPVATAAMAAGLGAALAANFTLQPALLSLMGSRYEWAAGEWIEPIHDGLFANDFWRLLRAMMMAALIPLLGLALWLHPPLPERASAGDNSTAAVNILASSPEAAEETIAKLKSVLEAGAIRWLGAFLPADVEAKQLVLSKLADVFPKIPPQQPSALDDLQQQMDILRESLNNIAAAPHARPELKSAADDFRRSLELFASTGTDRELLSFENRLFGGFNRLGSTAETLAALKPPELSDLDPALKSLFQASTGELRIEVTPANGATSLALAKVLDERGFPVAHPLLGSMNSLDLFWRNARQWVLPSLALALVGLLIAVRHWRGILGAVPVAATGLAGLAAIFLQLGFSVRPETLLLASTGLTFLILPIGNSFIKTPVMAQSTASAQHAAEAWALPLLIAAVSAPALILRLEPWSAFASLLVASSALATIVVGLYLAPLTRGWRDP